MAVEEWGEYGKKDWVEEVGEKKMAGFLIMQVEQVGLRLFPRESKLGWLFRVVRRGEQSFRTASAQPHTSLCIQSFVRRKQ